MGNPFAPDSDIFRDGQNQSPRPAPTPAGPVDPFQSAGVVPSSGRSGPAHLASQPSASPRPSEHSFAELNPAGFAGNPAGRGGTTSLPGSALPSAGPPHLQAGATAQPGPPQPQQLQYNSWPSTAPGSGAQPQTGSWDGPFPPQNPSPPWQNQGTPWQNPRSGAQPQTGSWPGPIPQQNPGMYPLQPQIPLQGQHYGSGQPCGVYGSGGGTGMQPQWHPGFPSQSASQQGHGHSPAGGQRPPPAWQPSPAVAQASSPAVSSRPQEVSGNALQRPFYPAGDGFRGGGGAPPPPDADSALWEFASLSSLKPKMQTPRAEAQGASREQQRPMRPSGEPHPPAGSNPTPEPAPEQGWAAFPPLPPSPINPQQGANGEATGKLQTPVTQQSNSVEPSQQTPRQGAADNGPPVPSSAFSEELPAKPKQEAAKKVPWALAPPKNDLPRPTSGGGKPQARGEWQPFSQGGGAGGQSTAAVATQLQEMDLLGGPATQEAPASSGPQPAGPSSALGRARAESLRTRKASSVAGRAPLPTAASHQGETEAAQRARAFLARTGLASSRTAADDEALARKLQEEYDAEHARTSAGRQARTGTHQASDWWKQEPQQGFQPVPPSHIAQDEELAQRLQREEDARQRRPQSWPQPPGHPRPSSEPPLNLWQPPQQQAPQAPQGYEQGYGGQGYGGQVGRPQGNTWWSGSSGPTQLQTGYPQAQAPRAPHPAAHSQPAAPTDDEAYARQLQEQFDHENAQGDQHNPNPSQSVPAPAASNPRPTYPSAPPPQPGSSWRSRLDRLVATDPQDLCRGCGQSISSSVFGGGEWREAFGGKWHPGCLRCGHCQQPITESRLTQKDDKPYHVHCYKEVFHPHCCVCADYLPEENNQIRWITDDFWKWKACPKHKDDGTTRCYACNRFQPIHEAWIPVSMEDKRHLCLDCVGSIVVDTRDAQPLYDEILRFYDGMGMRLPSKPPLLLVEASALESAETREGRCDGHDSNAPVTHTRGLTLSMEYRRMPTVVRDRGSTIMNLLRPEAVNISQGHTEVTAILVLAGLPRAFAGAILAHECMHAWLRLSGTSQLEPQVEEGLCQLMAVLWLGSLTPPQGSWEERLSSYCEHQIRVDRSLVYGDGFRAALDNFQKMGLPALVRHAQQTNRFPDSP